MPWREVEREVVAMRRDEREVRRRRALDAGTRRPARCRCGRTGSPSPCACARPPTVSVTIAASRPPNAMPVEASTSRIARADRVAPASLQDLGLVRRSGPCCRRRCRPRCRTRTTRRDEATRRRSANSAHVVALTLPPLGSMQCFTPTTESPSIAATSTARAPPKSSASPAIAGWKPATGAVAVPYSARTARRREPGGGRPARRIAEATGCGGHRGRRRELRAAAERGGRRGPLRRRGGAIAGRPAPARGIGCHRRRLGGTRASTRRCPATARRGWTRSRLVRGFFAGADRELDLVSPTTIVSPDWSLALLTFWPLTKVPFVEPRSMMLTSPGPLTSMIACIRLTRSRRRA